MDILALQRTVGNAAVSRAIAARQPAGAATQTPEDEVDKAFFDDDWDRIVALLSGAESIRDVIAFPKSGGGFDPLTAAPAPITPEQRREAGIDVRPGASRS